MKQTSVKLANLQAVEWFLSEEAKATSAMHETERKALWHLCQDVPEGGTVVEVGCQLGCSTTIIATVGYMRGYRTIHVDPYTQQPTYLNGWTNMMLKIVGDWDHRFTLLCGRTEQMIWELDRLLRDGIDMAFVDGDHDERPVAIDLQVVASRIKHNGVLVAHDYTEQAYPGVARAIDPFVAQGWSKIGQFHSMGAWRRQK